MFVVNGVIIDYFGQGKKFKLICLPPRRVSINKCLGNTSVTAKLLWMPFYFPALT